MVFLVTYFGGLVAGFRFMLVWVRLPDDVWCLIGVCVGWLYLLIVLLASLFLLFVVAVLV